jgi:division protein CdvB (Snf7/Vps24/ESCRT-III family)
MASVDEDDDITEQAESLLKKIIDEVFNIKSETTITVGRPL